MKVGDIILATNDAKKMYSGIIGDHKFFKITKLEDDSFAEIISVKDEGVRLCGTIDFTLFVPSEEMELVNSANDILIMMLSNQKEISTIEITTKCGRKIMIK